MASKPKEKPPEASAADNADGDAPAKPVKKPIFSKVMILAATGLLVVCGLGATAYFMLSSKAPKEVAAAPVKPPVFLDLPDTLVNLSNAGGERPQVVDPAGPLGVVGRPVARGIRGPGGQSLSSRPA